MELEGYSRPTYNKLMHSTTARSTVVGVIHKLTADDFFLSPQCRNYSPDSDHAHLEDSQSSQD